MLVIGVSGQSGVDQGFDRIGIHDAMHRVNLQAGRPQAGIDQKLAVPAVRTPIIAAEPQGR